MILDCNFDTFPMIQSEGSFTIAVSNIVMPADTNVNYTCDDDYEINGSPNNTCSLNAEGWINAAPICNYVLSMINNIFRKYTV